MIRGQMFMRQEQSGWSESWYFDGNDITAGLSKIRLIAGARTRLLALDTQVVATRASLVGSQADSQLNTSPFISTTGTAKDTPFQSALFKVRTATGRFRSLILRGLPDARVVDGEYFDSTDYRSRINAFIQALLVNGACIRGYSRGEPTFNAVGVALHGLLTTFDDTPWDSNQIVRFTRTKDTLGKLVNGTFRISAAPTVRTFQLNGWTDGRVVVGGTVRRIVYTPFPVTALDGPIRVISRKAGRPFGQPVGRRKRRN